MPSLSTCCGNTGKITDMGHRRGTAESVAGVIPVAGRDDMWMYTDPRWPADGVRIVAKKVFDMGDALRSLNFGSARLTESKHYVLSRAPTRAGFHRSVMAFHMEWYEVVALAMMLLEEPRKVHALCNDPSVKNIRWK